MPDIAGVPRRETRRLPAAGQSHVLAYRQRISRGKAGRRIHEADDLGPRQSVIGEPLPPRLEATAAAQRDGQIGNPGNELCSTPTDARVMRY
jgi:hypothetical protein